jgi:hypothetical protein
MKPIPSFTRLLAAGALMAVTSFSAHAETNDQVSYEVTVTNLTRGISFTPILAATHLQHVHFLEFGQPASSQLTSVAEAGDTGPLNSMILATPDADSASSDGLLGPGHTATIVVHANKHARFLSLAAMLLPTNDGFIALSNVDLPKDKETLKYVSNGYDAGTETNDELCAHIPGPYCGGKALSPNDPGEGFVHVHAGIHGIGDLNAAEYDWRNPVALITVHRLDD